MNFAQSATTRGLHMSKQNTNQLYSPMSAKKYYENMSKENK